MKTYWDVNEKDRADLTEEEMEKFFEIELMMNGEVIPKKPVFKEIEDPMEKLRGKREIKFSVGGISSKTLFDTIEDANKFLELNPQRGEYIYEVGYDYIYATKISDKIDQIVTYKKEDLEEVKEDKTIYENRKKEYEEDLEEYRKQRSSVEDLLSKIKEDKLERDKERRKLNEILQTYERFLTLAEGDSDIARTFLEEKYDFWEIEKAFELLDWLANESA
jgi:hypothetical protein